MLIMLILYGFNPPHNINFLRHTILVTKMLFQQEV